MLDELKTCRSTLDLININGFISLKCINKLVLYVTDISMYYYCYYTVKKFVKETGGSFLLFTFFSYQLFASSCTGDFLNKTDLSVLVTVCKLLSWNGPVFTVVTETCMRKKLRKKQHQMLKGVSSCNGSILRATERHLPYGITQCYLSPVTSEYHVPGRLIYPGGMEG